MCEIISEKKLREILDEVKPEEMAKLAYENWFQGMKSGYAIIDLETGELKGLSLGTGESTSPDFMYVTLYKYDQNWEEPDIDELLDDTEYTALQNWIKEKDWTQSEWEALEAFVLDHDIDLHERILSTVTYWIQEGDQSPWNRSYTDWVENILIEYEDYRDD